MLFRFQAHFLVLFRLLLRGSHSKSRIIPDTFRVYLKYQLLALLLLELCLWSGCTPSVDTKPSRVDSLVVYGSDSSDFIRAVYHVHPISGHITSSKIIMRQDTFTQVRSTYSAGKLSSRSVSDNYTGVSILYKYEKHFPIENVKLKRLTSGSYIKHGSSVHYFACSADTELVVPYNNGVISGIQLKYSSSGHIIQRVFFKEGKVVGLIDYLTGERSGDTTLSE